MPKTLLITYLPSGARSNTRKLLEAFRAKTASAPTETLDLLANPAPAFTEASMAAYVKRNYMKQPLGDAETRLLAPHDALVKQLKAADITVMAYPMHNFGMPGPVKTYLDAVMLAGETFQMGQKLMAGKKSLTLYTAGGQYPQHQVTVDYPNWDTLTLNAKINFNFMGFDECEVIGASLRDPSTESERFRQADQKLQDLVGRWYGP